MTIDRKIIDRRTLLAAILMLPLLPQSAAFADGDDDGDDDDDHKKKRRRKRRRRKRRRYRDNDGDKAKHDHDRAAAALKSGDIRPLREVLAKVKKSHRGEVVGIEFEMEDGIWVYELKIVTPKGRYLKIYVNAKTTKILKVRGR